MQGQLARGFLKGARVDIAEGVRGAPVVGELQQFAVRMKVTGLWVKQKVQELPRETLN